MKIDANDLERMAKDHPDERFLKGSGVLKLIGGIRMLEGQLRVAVALLNECAGPLEVSAAVIEDEDGGEAIETLISQVRKFCADAAALDARTAGVQPIDPCTVMCPGGCSDGCPLCGDTPAVKEVPRG